MTRSISLAALATVVIAGCGGGSDKAPGPRQVAQQYFTAIADGDADRACGLLAPTARKDAADYARAIGDPRLIRCETALGLADRVLSSSSRSLLRRVRVTSVAVHGERATATVAGVPRPVSLVRRDGAWRIARLDFRYQTFRVRAGQICTRYARTVSGLSRPVATRPSVLRYLQGLRSALAANQGGIASLGRPPERVRARDRLLAGFATQQRSVERAIAQLRSGTSLGSVVADFRRRQRGPARAVDGAQATLQIRCGQ